MSLLSPSTSLIIYQIPHVRESKKAISRGKSSEMISSSCDLEWKRLLHLINNFKVTANHNTKISLSGSILSRRFGFGHLTILTGPNRPPIPIINSLD